MQLNYEAILDRQLELGVNDDAMAAKAMRTRRWFADVKAKARSGHKFTGIKTALALVLVLGIPARKFIKEERRAHQKHSVSHQTRAAGRRAAK